MFDKITDELETAELKGFARSMSELQWLLLILVLLYFYVPTGPVANSDSLTAAMVGYAAFILVFRYVGFGLRETRLKLAIETWTMIGFITVVLWHTGHTESPLLNLYLLVIIVCALTLGKVMTLLEVCLIACCYLYLGYGQYPVDTFTAETLTRLLARFSPFLLVAYVTSLLAEDILAAKRKITLLSQTDELTGLLNMRAFNLMLEKNRTSAVRYRDPFSILMLDIDGLKDINDHYGHATGSQMISSVARALKNSVRASDVVARFGGDEFVLLLPHTTAEQAVQYAERIRTAVSRVAIDIDGIPLATSASIGIAGFPGNVSDPALVLERADAALYRSKQDGRNRITLYSADAATRQSGFSGNHARQYA